MQQPTPRLWFGGNAEEATNRYVAIFPNSTIIDISRYGDAGPGEPGSVLMALFELNGQRFQALSGGPIG